MAIFQVILLISGHQNSNKITGVNLLMLLKQTNGTCRCWDYFEYCLSGIILNWKIENVIMLSVLTTKDAISLLRALKAPQALIKHHILVSEAAHLLVNGLHKEFPKFTFDSRLVLVGAALHDTGKIKHRNEITGPGSLHEQDGEKMLLKLDIPREIARICRTHAAWASSDAAVEDRLVALADVLWKGGRQQKLETKIVEEIADATRQDFWDVLIPADSLFEAIADGGADRLKRSIN